MFSSFLRCNVLWLMVCCRRWSKAVRCRAVPGKTRPRVSSTLGLHMAGWGKREFRRPRRCAIGGRWGKLPPVAEQKWGLPGRCGADCDAGPVRRSGLRAGEEWAAKVQLGLANCPLSGRRMTPSPTRTARFLVRGKSSPRRRTANLLLPGPRDPPTLGHARRRHRRWPTLPHPSSTWPPLRPPPPRTANPPHTPSAQARREH